MAELVIDIIISVRSLDRWNLVLLAFRALQYHIVRTIYFYLISQPISYALSNTSK